MQKKNCFFFERAESLKTVYVLEEYRCFLGE